MSIEVAIICDGCGAIAAGGRSAAVARNDVREAGGKDLCRDCVAAGKQPE